MSLAVIFLARGGSDGLAAARAFFESYRQHPAGCEHDLIIVAKAWQDHRQLEELRHLAHAYSADIVELPDDGFDWGAYMRIAPRLNHTHLCLLNTHSRLVTDGWLEMLRSAEAKPGVGAAGATGSYGSLSATFPKPDRQFSDLILYPLRLVKVCMNFCRYSRRFPGFPNPHLRSNAILIQKSIFLSYISEHSIPKNKFDAHALESGRNGLTLYLKNQGLQSVIAGANGQTYLPEFWIESGAFRVPGQANLIVKDNQTEYYQNASPRIRRRLEQAAWGHQFSLE